MGRSSVCSSRESKHNETFVTDLERVWSVSGKSEVSAGELSDSFTEWVPRLVIPGIYVCCSRLFLFALCLECLARLFLFVLCLECLALPANGLYQLSGCAPLKHNERVWSRWFQVLFASGQGLLNRHLWKHSTSLMFFVLCAFYLPTKSAGFPSKFPFKGSKLDKNFDITLFIKKRDLSLVVVHQTLACN